MYVSSPSYACVYFFSESFAERHLVLPLQNTKVFYYFILTRLGGACHHPIQYSVLLIYPFIRNGNDLFFFIDDNGDCRFDHLLSCPID